MLWARTGLQQRLIHKEKTDEAQHGQTNLSFKGNVDLFKTLACYISANCLCELDQNYFAASHAPTRRLSTLGVVQNTPSVRGIPLWKDDLATAVCKKLVAAKGKHITTKNLNAHALGTLKMTPNILSLRVMPVAAPCFSGPSTQKQGRRQLLLAAALELELGGRPDKMPAVPQPQACRAYYFQGFVLLCCILLHGMQKRHTKQTVALFVWRPLVPVRHACHYAATINRQ